MHSGTQLLVSSEHILSQRQSVVFIIIVAILDKHHFHLQETLLYMVHFISPRPFRVGGNYQLLMPLALQDYRGWVG